MNKKFYELVFIISLKKDVEEVKNDIHEILKSYDVEYLDYKFKDRIGIRQFAYPIKKQEKGYYYILFVKMKPEDTVRFSKEIKLNEFILRYICFFKDVEKIEKLEEEENKKREKRKKREELLALEEANNIDGDNEEIKTIVNSQEG